MDCTVFLKTEFVKDVVISLLLLICSRFLEESLDSAPATNTSTNTSARSQQRCLILHVAAETAERCSHSDCRAKTSLTSSLVQCCFTSTRTISLIRD